MSMQGVISGYGVKLRQLSDEDVRIHGVNLDGVPAQDCIAVDGEDLGPCLAAVVDVTTGAVLWSDAAQGTPVPNPQEFGQAVLTVARGVLGMVAPLQP